jgi:hypothetical protein
MGLSRQYYWRWSITAIVPIVAATLFVSEAKATCGDYVRMGHVVDAAGETAPVESVDWPKAPDHGPMQPCSGPGCSQGRPQTPLPPPASTAPRIDHVACLIVNDQKLGPSLVGAIDANASGRLPAGHHLSILRPPRRLS